SKLVSSASGSLSQDNKKHNRIRRTQKKAKKNKIEDHLRTVKSSLNKESVVDSKATSSVINYVTNVNSDLKCASCCPNHPLMITLDLLGVKFLRSKDETPNFIIKFLKMIQNPYELLHSKLPDLSFFHVFGALCYPTNDSENLGKLQPKANIRIFIGYAPTKKGFRIYNRRTRRIVEKIHVDFDELTAMASEHRISGPALNEMTPGTISSGLVPTSSPSTYYVPPLRNDWDLLFQPMFDELLNPPPSVVNQTPEAIAPIAEVILPGYVDSTGSPFSIMVKQDAPSTSNSPTPTETQSSVVPQDVGDDNMDMEVAHMRNDPLFGVP
nr:retrovirus-related Pol polyprotein from transposon TNT 1-94 [Tanacetum cinerariifolium]